MAFGMSLSQFFCEDMNDISFINTKQKQLLDMTSRLDNNQLDALIHFLNTI